jgi:hypothetical protein
MMREGDLPVGQGSRIRVQPLLQKYLYLRKSEDVHYLRRPASTGGAYRDRH